MKGNHQKKRLSPIGCLAIIIVIAVTVDVAYDDMLGAVVPDGYDEF